MAASSRRCYCSVPGCSTSKQRQPYLSFHDFPRDEFLRKSWVKLIRRAEGSNFNILRGSTFVCSLHFDEESIYISKSGRKRLKTGATPTKFSWNSWGKKQIFERVNAGRLGASEDSCEETEASASGSAVVNEEEEDVDEQSTVSVEDDRESATDYTYAPPGVVVDAAAETTKQLEAKVRSCALYINRYCATDEEFRFYTRFPSEKVFWSFWESVAPSASRLVYWSRAQKISDEALRAPERPGVNSKMVLVDELFLFCCRVAVGLKEKMIAHIFGINTTTVSRVIIKWANYLHILLGSVPIWMEWERVQATMPPKLAQCCPNVRVILDCAEIRCEAPSSSLATFRGLIGVNPCGVITFISKLFTGSISDMEITQQSGILSLLEPGDACVADNGFVSDQMLSEVGATLITGTRLSRKDPEKRQSIARLRVLVERAIRRVNEYHIWDTTIPLILSGSVNQLWATCCLMSNYQGPLSEE